MSPLRSPAPLILQRFPRVSGDEPFGTLDHVDPDSFSPRERG